MFRKVLEEGLLNHNQKSNTGAKPFDVVMVFKIFILQPYYNLDDTQLELQITDRLNFKKILGLESENKIPKKTVWVLNKRHYRINQLILKYIIFRYEQVIRLNIP